MRRVAGEEHPANHEPLDDALVEAVGAQPVDLVRDVADDRPDPLVERAGAPLGLDVGVRRQLPVDTPDVVRLRMDHQLPTRIERRVVMEMPLLGQGQLGPDVGDQEPVGVAVAGPRHPDQLAQRAAYPVAGHHVLEAQLDLAFRGLRLHPHTVGVLRDPGDAVRPSHLAQRIGLNPRQHCLFDAVLRDVDEWAEADPLRVHGGADLFVAHVGASDVPGDAFGVDLIGATELVQHLEDVALDQACLRALLAQV